ncbi:MAG: efflux RND transporter periplasmic adaptor subunit [Gammaproteobacteria bacterium]|nr:efflux RND transporter periplasmic adaptor subunit [Gammaproteobacteria bacterium]
MFITGIRNLISPLFIYLFIFALPLHAQAESSDQPQFQDRKLAFAEVLYQEVEQERVLDAVVEAIHKATVSAQTSGRVSEIYFDVDDYVKKGDVLLRLRDKEQQANLNAAQAEFNQAQSEFNRVQEIYAKQLIAKSVVDKAESQLKSAQARLDQARENLEHTVVRAPYSGIVVKRHIEVGETARPGVDLFTGLSLESLRVVVNLPQDIISVVRQQKRARVFLLKNKAQGIDASSMTISPFADPDSHTFLVRVNLPQGDHGLYPGMAVKVAFATGTSRRLVVPVSSITHRSEVTAVYVQNKEHNLSLRQIRAGQPIRVAGANGDMIEVLSGLEEHEQIALDPVKAVVYFKEQNVIH